MEVRTPERQPPFDSFPSDASRKHSRSLDSDDDVPKRHKHRGDDGVADKHRSSGEKHKRKEDREERSSKHKHKHHRHKHRRKHRKELPEVSVDEIGSDKDGRGVEAPAPGGVDARSEDAKGDGLGSELNVSQNSQCNPNLRDDKEARDLNDSEGKLSNESGEDNLGPYVCTNVTKVARVLERIVEAGKPDCGLNDGGNFGEREDRCESGRSRDCVEFEKLEDELGRPSPTCFEQKDSEKSGSRDGLADSGVEKLITETGEWSREIDELEFHAAGRENGESAVEIIKPQEHAFGVTIESNQALIAANDEKEEGEILDEEEANLKPSESDIESGEIKTEEACGREEAVMDEISSDPVHANETAPFSFSQVTSVKATDYEACPFEENGATPFEENYGKGVPKCTPACQSLLGIVEAYDSEQGSEDHLLGKGPAACWRSDIDLTPLEVEVDDGVEVVGDLMQTKPGLNREGDRNDFDKVSKQSSEQKLKVPPSQCRVSEVDSGPKTGRESQDYLATNIPTDNQSQSSSSDRLAGKKRKHRSRSSSREGEQTKEGECRQTEPVSPCKDNLRDASLTEEAALESSAGRPDFAIENLHKRKRSSPQEGENDVPPGGKQRSNSQESEYAEIHSRDTLMDKAIVEADHVDHKRRSRSREGDIEARQHRDSDSIEHFNNAKREMSRDAVSKNDRRSRSREGRHTSKHLDERCEKRDQRRRSTSKESGHWYRSYQDSHARSDRGSRSKLREDIHDLKIIGKDRFERHERGRETALESRFAKHNSEKTDPDSRYSRHSSERSEWVRQSKLSLEKNEQVRRSRSREAAQDSRHGKDGWERIERGRRSSSREALYSSNHARDDRSEHIRRSSTRDTRVLVDYGRRSRSRDAGHLRVSDLDAVERRRRSKSPEGSRGNRDNLDRRRRSRSREIPRDRRDNHDRKRRSRSRESLRDQRSNDVYRYGRHLEGSAGGSHKERRVTNERQSHTAGRKVRGTEDLDSYNVERDKTVDQSSKDVNEGLREEENHEEYQERVASQLAAQEDEDLERIKEESRRRRQAILEKHKQQQKLLEEQQQQQLPNCNQQPQHQLQQSIDGQGNPEGMVSMVAWECSADANNQDRMFGLEGNVAAFDSNGGAVAFDAAIDPQTASADFTLGKVPLHNGLLPSSRLSGTGALGEGTPKSEKSNDHFCDYIFGDSPAGGRKLAKGDGLALETSGLTDNWDDAEGYYCYRIGEVLDGHYEIAASHGRGVFSSVVRARDLKASRGEAEEVAIKIIRNNDVMFKTGQQEHVILKKLAGADPENRRHCVRYLTSFEYRNHLCLVFESLHMNLREILKKFGRNIGINLNAVRAYAKQLFIALKHLKNCGVLHCDIKPDNMLVNEAKNVLKLCDFGSAMFAGENEITPYLVSRFYRAPEIILGLPYDHALDIWSVGCCLYEFYTGKVIFPGPTNNDMLRLHMELKGSFPKKMLKKASFASKHFDQDYNFCAIEDDPVTKTTVKRVLVNVKPKDIGTLIMGIGTADEDPKMLGNFKDILEKIFILDPDKRLTVSQALNHPFITGK